MNKLLNTPVITASIVLSAIPLWGQASFDTFMTPNDVLRISPNANLSLHNSRATHATVYGLYVRQFAYVEPGASCNSATSMYSSSNNITAGAFVTPTLIKGGQRAAVGSNYLYNMLYQAIYYIRVTQPVSPPGCALPGCTWGSDTHTYDWCIYLGALAPVANTSEYTSTVPPSTETGSSADYNYNIVTDYHYVGPIHCNDETMHCTLSTPQSQSFS